jgi:hypothetical protein
MTTFSWPAYPTTEREFKELMAAIDSALTSEGLVPFQRPLHVGRKLWEAFKWGGLVFPQKALAQLPGYEGDVLMAKAHSWYESTYGDQLEMDGVYGYAPAKLGNSVWRVRANITYGQVRLFLDRDLNRPGVPLSPRGAPASSNVLCAVESLPQGLVNSLPDEALVKHFEFHVLVHQCLQWRSSLPRTELFDMACADYDESTAGVLARRYGQARWAAQQAVEKTLKGMLKLAGVAYPTSGASGHNLMHLGTLLTPLGIVVSSSLLQLASCSTRVRYNEEPSTEEQAVAANHAVLGVLDQLRVSPSTAEILASGAGQP